MFVQFVQVSRYTLSHPGLEMTRHRIGIRMYVVTFVSSPGKPPATQTTPDTTSINTTRRMGNGEEVEREMAMALVMANGVLELAGKKSQKSKLQRLKLGFVLKKTARTVRLPGAYPDLVQGQAFRGH